MRKLHKILCLLLCACLLLIHSPLTYAQTQSDVIRISSLEEFLTFAENCRLDSFSAGKTFRLATDIDLTDVDFDGIPIFNGTFEGADHIISGLKITSAGSAKGLFRYLESTAAVRDLKVEGIVAPSGTRSQVGGIAGSNAGVIENCSFDGTVIGASHIGGIVGINLIGGVIRSCTVQGAVSGKHYTGGIAGSNDGNIQLCNNQANVNITAQQNQIDFSDITLDNLFDTESAAATTDIGGIAGFSSGMILGCVNQGDVGYKHMGYNVGGIAGRQTGYLASCENFGAVSGRKEVGGIVGQQEPQVLLKYTADTLQILQVQVTVLSDLVDRAVTNGNVNATHIRNLLYKIERYALAAQEAADYLKESVKHPKFEELQSYADAIETIRNSILGISDTIRDLWDAMDETVSDLDEDMKGIAQQIAQIESTLNNAEENLGGKVFDASDEDAADDLTSKTEACNNFGHVFADLNTGGVLGAISFENALNPEEDIAVVGDVSLKAIGSVRSVIVGCSNAGIVEAKYQRVGGIAGWLSMGLVKDCVNTAAVGSKTADYVGGIAGDCQGFIRNCKVKGQISGDTNVGGIAGCGAVASDCYAMVLLSGKERVGGILGERKESYHHIETPIERNYYLAFGADPGGIDGVSYDSKAKGLTLEIFLLIQEECEVFHYATVTFIADGEVVCQEKVPTGSAFRSVPEVPQKESYVGTWAGISDTDLSEVIFDLTFQAEYTQYSATIQAQETDEDGRPILLLQGDFATGAGVVLSKLVNFVALAQCQKLLQGWEFTVENCVTLHAGRFLLPQGTDTNKLILMIRDANGNWSQRIFTVDESYIVFPLGIGDSGIALLEAEADNLLSAEALIAAGVGALAVLVIIVIFSKAWKRKAKHSQDNAAS